MPRSWGGLWSRTSHNAEKPTEESELERPDELRRILIRYALTSGLVVLPLEMLLVGRWLFTVPLAVFLIEYLLGHVGTPLLNAKRKLLLWGSSLIFALLVIPAIFGWWWPIWWKGTANMQVYVNLNGWYIPETFRQTWQSVPDTLALFRWLLMIFLPLAWYIPTILASGRYGFEIGLPEFPNITLLETARSAEIFSRLRPDLEVEPGTPDIQFGYAMKELPKKKPGETWFLNRFPGEVRDLINGDQLQAARTVRDMFAALLAGAAYSRPEWCKRRKVLSQDAWHALNGWMMENHYARKTNKTTHKITRSGKAMMRAVVDAIDKFAA